MELPGSQNLLRAGCGCTGYDTQPITLLLMDTFTMPEEADGLVNTSFLSCCMAPVAKISLTVPDASCLCILLPNVACRLGLTLPTSARIAQEGLTCCEAELICKDWNFCLQEMLVNEFA